MDFPVWLVEFLTAPMLIPAVAVPHVIVAQFVVGGGFLLADAVHRARRDGQVRALHLLRGQTRVFMLISLVFGAVTGVGIWWTIGLASPETTRDLIRIFVFGWATEWVVFVVELVSLLAFYYLWDRVTPREHAILGWIYAAAAWLSLVLITGITSFMLTSGSWRPGAGFFTAFLNPSFLPQVLIRTGGSLVLGALGLGLIHALQKDVPSGDRDRLLRRFSFWGLAGMGLLLLGAAGYGLTLPDHARLNLMRAPILNAMTAAALLSGMVLLAALSAGFFSGSRWLNPPFALVMVMVAATAVTAGEFMREAARKPYRIERQVLAPGLRVADIETIRARGLVAASPWLREGLAAPGAPAEEGARRVRLGEAVFNYHCSACHAHVGYNGIVPIVQPWTPELLRDTIRHLHRTNPAMPPWVGSETEREALVAYLSRYAQGRPAD
jgi:cytochrome bd-type quinol oxidase subunit 1